MKEGCVIWLTGLPGSGKTTCGVELKKQLEEHNYEVELLDGNEDRELISSELGCSKEHRELHNKRVIHIAKLLSRHGVYVIVCLISPYKWIREYARKELPNFIEIYVKCPVEVCAARDKKGLYERAYRGEIKDLTGVQAPYEEPESPDVVIDTEHDPPDICAQKILAKLQERGLFTPFTQNEEETIKKRLEDLGYLG